jgi:hypothetical protein
MKYYFAIFVLVSFLYMQDTVRIYFEMLTVYSRHLQDERIGVSKMKIYFLVDSENLGSSKLRAYQISKELNSEWGLDTIVLSQSQAREYLNQGGVVCDEQQNAHVFIWIKTVNKDLLSSLRRCGSVTCSIVHFFDVVDSYALHKKEVRRLCENVQFDVVITNSKLMSRDMLYNIRSSYPTRYVVVHHHWDPDFIDIAGNIVQDGKPEDLVFGFLGSINSFVHSNNFMHLRKLLASEHRVVIIDTESGLDVTRELKVIADSHEPYNANTSQYRMKIPFHNIKIPFNVHLSIREEDTDLYNFKTTAKVVTAAALNHIIVSTKEGAASEILPDDYPFWLESSKEYHFFNKLHEMRTDYDANKSLWNRARSMLEGVRRELSLRQVCKNQYMPLLSSLTVPGRRINDGFFLL